MLRSSLYTAGALLICASAYGQQELHPDIGSKLRPVTAPMHRIEGKLDLRTGQFTRQRNTTIGQDGLEEIYDNTCFSGTYVGLEPAGNPGTGSAFPESIGDYGAIPASTFVGDAVCTVGCADTYEINAFEIAWCQLAAPSTGAVMWLDFWDPPQAACQPGNGPIGAVRPPAVTTVLSATITGLPRNNMIGTLACYILTLDIGTPGFTLTGSGSFAPGSVTNPNFAWAMTMPTTTGLDGPITAGDLTPFTSPCAPCEGTIFENPMQTTNTGTGAGQAAVFFAENYGGTSVTGDCFFFGGPQPTGYHLELFSVKPCEVDIPSVQFCNATDGSLASCPCSNPGAADTGCDSPVPPMQGGGTTGGILLQPIAQEFGPPNRATLQGTGYPAGSAPGVVHFRNNGIDPLSPVVFGDGIRCVDATTSPTTFVRIGAVVASGGVSTAQIGHGGMAGVGTFYYQAWFRSTPISFCDPAAAFNLRDRKSVV